MNITADQARPGDVVLAPGDENFPAGVYQAPPDANLVWSGMTPIGAFGPIPKPQGELVLLVRDGQPVEGRVPGR
jgi:hypothetical protein